MSAAEWVGRYFTLPPDSARPGPYELSEVPYFREILDSITDPTVGRCFLSSSAQVGKTTLLLALLCFLADEMPGPAMMVYPTENAARSEAKGRIKEAFERTPRVMRRISGERWASGNAFDLGSMKVAMAWANAPTTLIRIPCKTVFVDELDNCDSQAGRLGNILTLVEKRSITYGYRSKLYSVTTPGLEDGSSWREYQASDRRVWHMPCSRCGQFQTFIFELIKWPSKATPDELESKKFAWYECAHCQGRIEERERRPMVKRGLWVPKTQSIVGTYPDHKIVGETAASRTRGWHVWAAMGPSLGFSEIAADFLRSHDDPQKLRVHKNQIQGLPWKEAGQDIKLETLEAKLVGALPRDVVPSSAQWIIMSADVQKDHIYYVVRAWGPWRTSWLIREGIVATLPELYEIGHLRYAKENGKDWLSPTFLVIDTGYRAIEVYDFCRTHDGCIPVKGVGVRQDGATVWAKIHQVTPEGERQRYGIPHWLVVTEDFRGALYTNLQTRDGEPGAFHLNRDASPDYLKQLGSHERVYDLGNPAKGKKGKWLWRKKLGFPNDHYLDAEIYGMAIGKAKGFLDLTPPEPGIQPGSAPEWVGRGPMGYQPRKFNLR